MFGENSDANDQVIKNIQVLDGKTFERLYLDCWEKVFGIIFNYTRDEEIAEEISQDLFASIWERKDRIMVRTTFEQYLYRAAKLEAFEYLRTSIRHREHVDCALQNYCAADLCTEERVYFNELNGSVNLLVDQLPCRCREVYRLSQQQGLTNKAIASKLLISEKTVEYHLYKAMSFLRSNLKAYQ
ncbi:RNA polymerase sigma-70 factor [Pedobacter metabolipauper]|uniref:RNA polymerase sigma-70 factor (ECF subfamily) n=1 Tax=Pedobacter metabolipauper TaxID=425513 RepID=A0A4R6T0H0_9SPHI|nr:RNA polymerase sigma-70 factor [Pedobacter metabolipauper]TDQ11068.1 RNA polymerase sigma-70 factor (ECF subfamily) [Pedobacter metabolipauper]